MDPMEKLIEDQSLDLEAPKDMHGLYAGLIATAVTWGTTELVKRGYKFALAAYKAKKSA